MKIVQLVQQPQHRGVETFTAQLSGRINASGHKAVMVFLFPGSAELPFAGTVHHLQGQVRKRFWDFAAWKRLAQIIATEQPDIIQANAGDTLLYAVFSKMCFRWKQPIVFRNASIISLYIKNRWSAWWHGLFFQQTKNIVSVSQASADDFAALFPAQKKKIVTIPVGVEDDAVDELGKLAKEKDRTGQTPEPSFVHVGGFTFEKNHKGLLAIFEEILRQRPGAKLDLVGDGPLKEEIEERVREKGLGPYVRFHGLQKTVWPFLNAADALLLPSLIEGLPGVVLEAFLCRTPVVAFRVGGVGEIVRHGQTGWLLEKGENKAFATAALEAVKKNPSNKRIVQNAYQLVAAQYLNSRITQEFLSVYASLLPMVATKLKAVNPTLSTQP